MGGYRNGSARIHIVFGLLVVVLPVYLCNLGVRDHLADDMDGREVFQIRDQDFVVVLIYDAGSLYLVHHKREEGALGGFLTLSGNADLAAVAKRIRKRELRFLRQIQDPKAGRNLPVGLEFRLDAEFHHIDEGFVITGFRVEIRDGDLIKIGLRVRHNKASQFLLGVNAVSYYGRQACQALPVGSGSHIFRLMTGNCRQGEQ